MPAAPTIDAISQIRFIRREESVSTNIRMKGISQGGSTLLVDTDRLGAFFVVLQWRWRQVHCLNGSGIDMPISSHTSPNEQNAQMECLGVSTVTIYIKFSSHTWIHLATGREGITAVATRTTASWNVIANLAIGVYTTGSGARVHTFSVPADLRVAALVMVQATAAMTVRQGISLVAGRAGAHRTATNRFLATCTGSARIPRTALGCSVSL